MTGLQFSDNEIRVVALSGSLREQSYTRMALNIALEGAESVGAQTRMLDLREYDLPMCNPDIPYPESVHRLRGELRAAQGIILGTPEYHGSYSGVLKNALDLMGFEEFEGRIVGLVGVAGGRMGAANSLNALQMIGRALHAWVLPQQVSIPQAWKLFNDDGHLNHEELHQRLFELGHQVARFAYLHTSKQTLDFLKAWEVAPENPGGDHS